MIFQDVDIAELTGKFTTLNNVIFKKEKSNQLYVLEKEQKQPRGTW